MKARILCVDEHQVACRSESDEHHVLIGIKQARPKVDLRKAKV
jgi:hypothetical protein